MDTRGIMVGPTPPRRRHGRGAHCACFRHNRIAYNSAMAISPHWYRENANACAWRAEQSRDPLVKAAYKEMVRAWLILAACVEEYPPRGARIEEQALAA
jgi:hypothetical protein